MRSPLPVSRRRKEKGIPGAGSQIEYAAMDGNQDTLIGFDRGQLRGFEYGQKIKELRAAGIDENAVIRLKDDSTGKWYDHGPAIWFKLEHLMTMLTNKEAKIAKNPKRSIEGE